MRKLLVVPCLMVLLTACGDSQTQEGSLLEESSLSTRESALCGTGVNYCWVCGFSNCGNGDYAPYNYGCIDGGNPSSPCGACTTGGVNATQCVSTTGSQYWACGIDNELRPGFRVWSHGIDPYCDAVYSSNGGTQNNKTFYVK